MGLLYDSKQRLDRLIADRKLNEFKTKGAIGLKAGFVVGLITPDTPDDSSKIAKLKAAVREVLGVEV